MEDADSHIENQPPKERDNVHALVEWMRLQDVPSAAQLDPDGGLGLKDAFREVAGRYPDPVPQSVIEQAKREVAVHVGNVYIDIPILQETVIPVGAKEDGYARSLPLFREQVLAVAQYLDRLGIQTPPSTATQGDTFVLIGTKADRDLRVLSTKERGVSVIVRRSMLSESAPVKRVELSVCKAMK